MNMHGSLDTGTSVFTRPRGYSSLQWFYLSAVITIPVSHEYCMEHSETPDGVIEGHWSEALYSINICFH